MKTTITKAADVKSRRRDRRIMTPLGVVIDDAEYPAIDWSLGGFRIGDYVGQRQVGEEIDVDLYGHVGGVRRGGSAIALVVRRDDEAGELAARFEAFIDDAWDQLEQLALRRLRRPRVAAD